MASLFLKLTSRRRKHAVQNAPPKNSESSATTDILAASTGNPPFRENATTKRSEKETDKQLRAAILLKLAIRRKRKQSREAEGIKHDDQKDPFGGESRGETSEESSAELSKQTDRQNFYLDAISEHSDTVSAALSLYEEELYADGALEAERWLGRTDIFPNDATAKVPFGDSHTLTSLSSQERVAREPVELEAMLSAASSNDATAKVAARGPVDLDITLSMASSSDDESELPESAAVYQPSPEDGMTDNAYISALTFDQTYLMGEQGKSESSFDAAASAEIDAIQDAEGSNQDLAIGTPTERQASVDTSEDAKDEISLDENKRPHILEVLKEAEEWLLTIEEDTSPEAANKKNIGEIEQPHLLKVKEAEKWIEMINERNKAKNLAQSTKKISVVAL